MRILSLVLLLTLGLCHGLFAKVIYVDDNASVGGDGTSWATAYQYLQDAIASVASGDEVWVAEGTYKPSSNGFRVLSNMKMYGGFKGFEGTRDPAGDWSKTTLSGAIDDNSSLWCQHVLRAGSSNSGAREVLINGFRITNGNADGSEDAGKGGGIFLYKCDSTFIIRNCTFERNLAEEGGAIHLHDSDPIIENCSFKNNEASKGGAIYMKKSSPKMSDCSLSHNKAVNGGGIYAGSLFLYTSSGYGQSDMDSSPIIVNCSFIENSAKENGGGAYFNAFSADAESISEPYLKKCLFKKNTSSLNGGGVLLDNGASPTFTACVFEENNASKEGGAVYEDVFIKGSPRPIFTNCVFTKNDAEAGSIISYIESDGASFHYFKILNCTIVGNPGQGIKTRFGVGSPSRLELSNNIFYNNLYEATDGFDPFMTTSSYYASTDEFKNWLLDITGKIPAKSGKVRDNVNLLQNWEANDRIINTDPLFVNINDPDGPDDLWFTADDGFRLQEGSPAIDAGYDDSLPYLYPEHRGFEADKNTSQAFPRDIAGFTRIQNNSLDLGAYEFGDSTVVKYRVIFTSSPIGGGTVTGSELIIEEGKTATFTATPNPGFLFQSWRVSPPLGFLHTNNPDNPITLLVDGTKSVTVNFSQDRSDSDSDGLSNYAELVTHGTKWDDNDTDDDGLLDNEEIQIGTDPKSSDSTLVNFFNAKSSTGLSTARTTALDEGRTVGIEAVKANPSQHGLYTQADLNASAASARTAGIEEAKALGQSEGQAAVKADPTAHNLVTKDAYDQMVEQLINSSDSGSTTPYTDGWFYYPSRGWMFTKRSIYPYFYDSSTKAWMYFKSGEDKPRFYHYGTKTWVTLGE